MRLVFISDTHTKHRQIVIPDGDVLVHCGDISSRGELYTVVDFNDWLGTLPHQNKIIIAGNHEIGFRNRTEERKRELFSNAIYLENSGTKIGNINFWGSPYQPYFHDWEYNFPDNEKEYRKSATKIWGMIPDNTDILITHGPAYGVLDEVNNPGQRENSHVGCKFLLERTESLPNLKIHTFGHIHEGYGILLSDSFTSVNASILDDRYNIKNKPVVLDI